MRYNHYYLSDEAERKIKRLLNIDDLTPWRMRIECIVTRFKDAHSQLSPRDILDRLEDARKAVMKAIDALSKLNVTGADTRPFGIGDQPYSHILNACVSVSLRHVEGKPGYDHIEQMSSVRDAWSRFKAGKSDLHTFIDNLEVACELFQNEVKSNRLAEAKKRRRPVDYDRHIFVHQIGNIYQQITGQKVLYPTPNSAFIRFIKICLGKDDFKNTTWSEFIKKPHKKYMGAVSPVVLDDADCEIACYESDYVEEFICDMGNN